MLQMYSKKIININIEEVYKVMTFVGVAFGFGDIVFLQISLSDHGLYSLWSAKKLIDKIQLRKFMHVGIDVTYMHTNFGGHVLSGFGDIATFKNSQISLSDHGL